MALNPKREPHILLDPISGFFAGFTSVFARMFLGFVAIVIGYLVCAIAAGGIGVYLLSGFPMACFFMIFKWATLGGVFIIGMAALISIFAGLWAFVHDGDARRTFFFIITASVVYFSVLLFSWGGSGDDDFDTPSHPIVWAIVIYTIGTALYWVLPIVVAKFMTKNTQEEIETVPPIDEHPSAQMQSAPFENHEDAMHTYEKEPNPSQVPDETGAAPSEQDTHTGTHGEEELPITGAEPLKHPADEELQA